MVRGAEKREVVGMGNKTGSGTQQPGRSRSSVKPEAGAQYGRWTLVRRTDFTKRAKWLARCQCGSTKEVFLEAFVSGRSVSCGCHRKEQNTVRLTTHGQSGTKIYRVWFAMLERCRNPKDPSYENYGGRGIRVCDEWQDFATFAKDVGKRPKWASSLDRKDNDGHYEPNNVRWANATMQCRNQRRNRLITYQGRTQCINAWAEELGVDRSMLATRLDRQGLSVEEAFTRKNRYANKR